MNNIFRAISLLGIAGVTLMRGQDGGNVQQDFLNGDKQLKAEFAGSGLSLTFDIVGDGGNALDSYGTGKGSLGQFTLRTIDQLGPNLGQTTRCGGNYELRYMKGALVITFGDSSQVFGNLKNGYICYDASTGKATYIEVFTLNKGTGRFSNAAGEIRLRGTSSSPFADATAFYAFDGTATGTISN